MPETLVAEEENTTRHTVSFADPLSSAPQPSLFTMHHVPEDQAGAAKEAIRQAGIMMEQLRTIGMRARQLTTPVPPFKAMFRSVDHRLFC